MTEENRALLTQLKAHIQKSSKIVALTGAGLSVPSGIPDFRSAGGLYTTESGNQYPPEYMLSHTCYKRQPEAFFRFYKEKMIYPQAVCNVGHQWLRQLEAEGRLTAVITQNIDGLQTKAGSKSVFEFHGSVYRNYCERCSQSFDLDYVMQSPETVPRCNRCGGTVRPDVVLYEEPLNETVVQGSVAAVREADMLLVIGTSLVVYPAAGLIDYFKGHPLVLINKSATPYDRKADWVIHIGIEEAAPFLMSSETE